MIPYGRQEITQEDVDSVVDVLKSDLLTQGPLVPAFEAAIRSKTNAKFVSVLNSATSALHVSCAALGVTQGDHVWTVPNTFVASANCALYCGAKIDFVDIDPRTLNLSLTELERKLHLAKKLGRSQKWLFPFILLGSRVICVALKIWVIITVLK